MPSLEFLKKLAKDRLHDLRRRDPRAKLAMALLSVAREYGARQFCIRDLNGYQLYFIGTRD